MKFEGVFNTIWGKKTGFLSFLKIQLFKAKSQAINGFYGEFPFQKCMILLTLLLPLKSYGTTHLRGWCAQGGKREFYIIFRVGRWRGNNTTFVFFFPHFLI